MMVGMSVIAAMVAGLSEFAANVTDTIEARLSGLTILTVADTLNLMLEIAEYHA
jgi:hypothetical protein